MKENNTIISKLMYGLNGSLFICQVCQNVMTTYDNFMAL
jgi:ubiquitin C-terminal hydrolase